MAVAALLIWLCTAAVGSYLLATAASAAGKDQREQEGPVPVPAAAAGGGPAAAEPPRDRFDPPSLQRAKSEPVPGWRALAEFSHPALAVIGLGFWLGYIVSRRELFAVISLGIVLGAVAAGLSWAAVNNRAHKRAAAGELDLASAAPGTAPLSVSHRVLLLHVACATVTVLLVVLVAVHA